MALTVELAYRGEPRLATAHKSMLSNSVNRFWFSACNFLHLMGLSKLPIALTNRYPVTVTLYINSILHLINNLDFTISNQSMVVINLILQ